MRRTIIGLGLGLGLGWPSAGLAEPAAPAPPAAAAARAEEPAAPGGAGAGASAEARAKAPVVSDGPVTVSTRLSPDPSNVGDLLTLEIVAAYPRDVRVNLPTKLSFEPLHHVRTEEGEPEPTGDGLRKVFRVELQRFETGEGKIPGFPLTYVDAEGGVHTVQIPPRTFEVESLLVNEDDPQRRGEDPPISREYPDTRSEVIIWSALATLLAALVGWLSWRRVFGRARVVAGPPPIPPHELAFEALDELEHGDLLAQGQVQRYYVELTEIAKGYLEGRFSLDALDRTTEEIRSSLRRDPGRVAPLAADEVIGFLEECDLVKFARLQPAEREARDALGTVREMVQGSMLVAPAPAAAKAEADASNAAEAVAGRPVVEPGASGPEPAGASPIGDDHDRAAPDPAEPRVGTSDDAVADVPAAPPDRGDAP